MKGLSTVPWFIRFYRRYFEAPSTRKRRRAREHKAYCQRMMYLKKMTPPVRARSVVLRLVSKN